MWWFTHPLGLEVSWQMRGYHREESRLFGAGSRALAARRWLGLISPIWPHHLGVREARSSLNFTWLQDQSGKCLRRRSHPPGAAGYKPAVERGRSRAVAPLWCVTTPIFVESVISINGRESHWELKLSPLRWLRYVWACLVNLHEELWREN